MMWSGFKSRCRRHMWVEFVVGSLPCFERLFSWYSGFPNSSKTNTSKFEFDQESGRRRTTLWMMWSGFKSRCRRHMWVEFVVGSLPCSKRFFSGYSGFPLSSKTITFQNSNSTRNRVEEEPLCGYATSKSLCIYFIHLKVNLFIDNLIKDFLCKLLHKKHFYLNYWKLSLPLETSGVSLLRIL